MAERQRDEVDVFHICGRLAGACDAHEERLRPFAERYGGHGQGEADRLRGALFQGTRSGGLGLLRDLHDLHLMVSDCDMAWTLVGQAARGLRDPDLLELATACQAETEMQLRWLRTRLKQAAPQALVVAR
ncbi:MAG TPA: hypothetical protein VF545_12775 [Thermoleophilaceae bacterium]